jgi:hypothetical protein
MNSLPTYELQREHLYSPAGKKWNKSTKPISGPDSNPVSHKKVLFDEAWNNCVPEWWEITSFLCPSWSIVQRAYLILYFVRRWCYSSHHNMTSLFRNTLQDFPQQNCEHWSCLHCTSPRSPSRWRSAHIHRDIFGFRKSAKFSSPSLETNLFLLMSIQHTTKVNE